MIYNFFSFPVNQGPLPKENPEPAALSEHFEMVEVPVREGERVVEEGECMDEEGEHLDEEIELG